MSTERKPRPRTEFVTIAQAAHHHGVTVKTIYSRASRNRVFLYHDRGDPRVRLIYKPDLWRLAKRPRRPETPDA